MDRLAGAGGQGAAADVSSERFLTTKKQSNKGKHDDGRRAARPQPNLAKRLERAEFAAFFERPSAIESGSRMSGRLNLLPDPAFLELRPILTSRLDRLVAGLQAEQFSLLLDPLMRQTLARGFAEAGAHEGTVWLLGATGDHLVPVHNTGPNSSQLVGKFKQPLNAGLVCMVFASEQPFLENEVWKNAAQSKLLDSQLQVQTGAMIAVPFYFLNACRGVVSCVQLRRPAAGVAEPPGFRPQHLASVQLAAALLSQLIEFRLLSRAVGWTSD